MKHAWSRALMVALGAGLLWGAEASAKSREQQEREDNRSSCEASCTQDLKECSAICKKHAGAGLNVCVKACKDAQKECETECKYPGGGE
jgi:hypothetical protein